MRERLEKSGRVLQPLVQLPFDRPALRAGSTAFSRGSFRRRRRAGRPPGCRSRRSAKRERPASSASRRARRARPRPRSSSRTRCGSRARSTPRCGAASGRPGDFLVLFRTRKFMSEYARALEARGIPYELSGGGAFKDSEELRTLLPLLAAISDPDDPVPFTAVLRGPLFGVDDEALYRHFRAGGRFSFRAALPPERRSADRAGLRAPARRRGARGGSAPGAAISRLCGAARLDRVRGRAGARRQPRRQPPQGHRRGPHVLGRGTRLRRGRRGARPADERGLHRGDERAAGPARRGAPDDRPRRQGSRGPGRVPRRPAPGARPADPVLDRPPTRERARDTGG